jgi:hypothetical protein
MLRHYRDKHGITSLKRRYAVPQTERYTPPPPPLTEGYMSPPPLTEGYKPPQQQYSQSNEEEPYYILKTKNPCTFYVPDKYDPDHFMPWVHPFTSVISGPTGSGKSVFVRRFVHNIRHIIEENTIEP